MQDYSQLSNLIMKRQMWGPLLIVIGTFSLFYLITSPRYNSFPQYVVAGVGILLVLAGITMMFVQLRGEDMAISAPSSEPDRKADPEYLVVQLGKNYDILRRQTTQGFMMAGVFMALGILVILSGSVGKMFGFAAEGSDLTSVAGIIMEFISGTSLLMYRINFRRLNDTSDRLDATWRILTAHRLSTSLPEDWRANATMKLIDALLASPNQESFNKIQGPSTRSETNVGGQQLGDSDCGQQKALR